jgi:hypothetical protein
MTRALQFALWPRGRLLGQGRIAISGLPLKHRLLASVYSEVILWQTNPLVLLK